MKERAEQMAGRAIMQLTEVATLLAGHSGLQEMMDRMNQQINKDI